MPSNDQRTIHLDSLAAELDVRLADADRDLAASYPGPRGGRQPVHTVYVPADRFEADLAQSWGDAARQTLDEHAEAFSSLVADASVVQAVRRKLAAEPIEDLRIDFED